MNRKKLALCLLLLCFAASVVYSIMGAPKEKRVTTLKNRPGAPAPVARKPVAVAARKQAPTAAPAPAAAAAPAPAAAAAPAPAPAPAAAPNVASSDPGRLRLDLLDQEAQRFNGFRRNIFSPIFREELKLPPFKPLPPPPRPVVKLPPPPPPMPMPMPVIPPPPTPDQIADSELSKFTFLGFLKKNAERTVFLSSNNEIFLAKKGSKLGTKFLVADVTDEAITIKALAGGREIVIPLVENRTLSRRSSIRTP